jgi:hypothetical protein
MRNVVVFSEKMMPLVTQNGSMGNCLGLTEDLEQACRDYCSGSLAVTVDSIFCNNQVGAFLERSYKATDRFGKVVYEYT